MSEGGLRKHRLAALGLGALALALVFGFMSSVSLDMRWVFLVGAVALFASGLWLGRPPDSGLWTWILLCLPLVGVFGWVALRELPAVWPHLLLWAIAGAAGLAVSRAAAGRRALPAAAAVALAFASAWYMASYLPMVISRALTKCNVSLRVGAPLTSSSRNLRKASPMTASFWVGSIP